MVPQEARSHILSLPSLDEYAPEYIVFEERKKISVYLKKAIICISESGRNVFKSC